LSRFLGTPSKAVIRADKKTGLKAIEEFNSTLGCRNGFFNDTEMMSLYTAELKAVI
jgi:hypothetical protein